MSYDQDSRQISITIFKAVFDGKMPADGKVLDTSMTEPGYHVEIHFVRVSKKAAPNTLAVFISERQGRPN